MAAAMNGFSSRWLAPIGLTLLLPLGALSFLNRATSLHGEDGIRWAEASGALKAASVTPDGPGERAGVETGDLLLSVDGVPVTGAPRLRDLLWGKGGVSTAYRLRRGETEVRLLLIPALNGEENRFFYYLWVAGMVGFGAGCLAIWRLRNEPAAPLLFLLSAALCLVFALSPGGGGGALDWIFYWGDLAGRLLAPPLLIHFVLRVADGAGGRDSRPLPRAVLYVPSMALVALNLYLIPFRGALRFSDPSSAMALKDRLELLMISIYGAAAVLLLFLRLWTATRARIRWRLRWLALSAAAALLPLAVLYGLPVALRIPPGPVGELSVFPLCLLPLGFAAALFQERTVDLDRSLRRAVQGTLGTTVLLGGAFLFSWILGRLPGGETEGGILTEVILPLGGSALAMLLLRGPTRRVTQSLFGSQPPALGQVLPELRTVLNGEIDLDELARGLLHRLIELFRLECAVLMVREGSEDLFRAVPFAAESPGTRSPVLGKRFAAELATREVVFLDEDGSPPGVEPVRFAGCRYLFPLCVRGDLKAILLTGSHRDGSPLEAEALESLSLIADQAARSVDAARLHQEIRERILREEKLRGETEAILEASRIGILLADRQGFVTLANGAAAAILGQDSLQGAPLDRLLPRGLLLLLDRSRRDHRAEAHDRAFRYSFGASDGRTRVINVTRAALTRPGEGGHVYTLDDVTEEMRLEEKMMRQDHLASMGLLASQVAHEVNTPLTGIASYAQILMARLSSKLPEMDLLRKIENQAFRAAGIAGSVLNFARRREADGFQVLDPGPVIAECLSLFEPHLKGKRIRVSTQRAAGLPGTRMNRGRVQQAVMNLLLNAAQALPEGGEIGLATDYQGAHLRIRVTDNGVGIPAEIQARIFEPFFTTRSSGEGTGLGLSIVRQIVREHGGLVEVQSRQGAGSTFTLRFPAEAPAAARKTAHG